MKIVISQRVEVAPHYKETRDALSQNWTMYLEKFNALPFPIPNTLKNVAQYLDVISPEAIILTGGNDISPTFYENNQVTEEVSQISIQRDQTELQLLQYGCQNRIPIIGVCRGFQIIQVFFGGSLVKIKHQLVSHVGQFHKIEIVDKKYSKYVMQKDGIQVNSFHNFGVHESQLAAPLIPFAVCKQDGIVEGFYHPTLPILGIQWHPERDNPASEFDYKLFRSVIGGVI